MAGVIPTNTYRMTRTPILWRLFLSNCEVQLEMGTCCTSIQRLRRTVDHLFPLNPTSCCSSLRSRSAQPKDWNFFNLYKYHRAIKSICSGSLKLALFAEKGSIQKHIRSSRFSFDLVKIHYGSPAYGFPNKLDGSRLMGYCNIHTSRQLSTTHHNVVDHNEMSAISGDPNGTQKPKIKKLKGKRAVVRWLKFFRWKKKKEYDRMTSEEKILFKLKKAQKKEEHLVEAMKKIEPKDSSVTTHDPEILTPEEHFYLLKLGQKGKNYVPVGRRGIFQGVILNMHLHWKKHQTVKVVVKTFTTEEVREIAAELARLTGGIVLEIGEDSTIIMYRGKNYSQPPTEIMSPKVTLTRKKALDKSKYRDALHAVRRYIPKLEQDFEDLHAEMKSAKENKPKVVNREETQVVDTKSEIYGLGLGNFEGFCGLEDQISELKDNDSESNIVDKDESSSSIISDAENLSDIFESDSDAGMEDKDARPLYLDEIERFPSEDDGGPEDFQEHLRQISAAARRGDLEEKDLNMAELDDIDKIFLSASSLLKKKR